ncbi:phage tail fiber protein [Proteus vulgaris]|uniref:phage tail fiber protein n=1 Tax=Proteus vulgaris TaxID=585 RepID=UPI0010C36B2C|nr:hypothetical protein [Proteus vulgaris]UBH60545.1 hypothetical protein LA322_10450 [Proteus vulgaris]VTP85340.1 Uncharacterised protein [Proteus vulgaris]
MIYTTGTVNTVSGSAIVRGTDTKFKNNNPAINIGMTILIKSGTTNIPYMIKSVNSDTELVLAHPALATATNTTFSIHVTEPDNNSDAARTMVAINAYTQYFLDAMNTWMTQTGQTKIEMPNGEIVTLDSIKKMQGDISNKADLVTTESQIFKGQVISHSGIYSFDGNNSKTYFGLLRANTGDPFGFYCSYNGAGYSIRFPERKGGTLMLVGDYGWGGSETPSTNISEAELRAVLMNRNTVTQIIRNEQTTKYGLGGSPIAYFKSKDTYQALVSSWNGGSCRVVAGNATSEYVHNLWTDRNTTVDSNGFIKRASPIIDINSDGRFTTNDESEGATVTRVAQGEYLIEGVLGFNADAGWGGVDGGIEIPLDVNKQPLIWVNSEVNEDGSILVKTYHRTHPNAPKFARNDIDGFNDSDPIDIPAGRFISVRVQMPEQSIYNVRMREMEEAQKAEEERRQKEEEENQDTNKAPEIDN